MRWLLTGLVLALTAAGCAHVTGRPTAAVARAEPGMATVASFGDAASFGAPSASFLPRGLVRTTDGQGYWVFNTTGAVAGFGDAPPFGSLAGQRLNRPIVGMAATPTGRGYWLVASDGGVFTFGDAVFHGSTGAMALNQPIVGMAATPTGRGYWLVASDGGVFTFGDAVFHGSTGAMALNQPIVGMAATPTGRGYWLVARDGGVFTFGDARWLGSAGATPPPAPVVAMTVQPSGRGYWLVASDGTIRAFGDVPDYGSPHLPGVTGIAATKDGGGYWTVSSGAPLVGRVVAVDPGHDGGNEEASAAIDRSVFVGNGYKACDTDGTETASGYTEHAFTWDVAQRLAVLLEDEGATVVLTRDSDSAVGPCVDQRAEIGNAAHADAAVSIHADGGPSDGRGFTVIEPLTVHPYNDAIVGPSATLGADMVGAYATATGLPTSTYDGVDGASRRDDLGGLNLSTVPKVLIETGNMQNGPDAALLETAAFRQSAATGIAAGITAFLTG